MIPEWGRSPGEGHGNPLQDSCLENPHGQRSLVGYSPWSRMHQVIKVGPNAVTGILMRRGNLDIGKLMAQRVKNPPAMQEIEETWFQSLDREDPLEKKMATHSSILAWEIPWTKEPGVAKSQTQLTSQALTYTQRRPRGDSGRR